MFFNRLGKFAHQREPYHYDNITYNTRDLGGYKTKDGKYMVKPNQLIRSPYLQNIDTSGVNFLRQKGVTLDIDLRNSVQRRDAHDFSYVKHPGIKVIYDSVYSDESFFSNPDSHYCNIYTIKQPAIKAYRKAIKLILNNHGATIFHCIQGRDRTGIVSILLLTALGVSHFDIINDYLLTRYYGDPEPYFDLHNNLKNFYHTIDRHYGSIKGYLPEVGLDEKNIEKLRKQYLMKIK